MSARIRGGVDPARGAVAQGDVHHVHGAAQARVVVQAGRVGVEDLAGAGWVLRPWPGPGGWRCRRRGDPGRTGCSGGVYRAWRKKGLARLVLSSLARVINKVARCVFSTAQTRAFSWAEQIVLDVWMRTQVLHVHPGLHWDKQLPGTFHRTLVLFYAHPCSEFPRQASPKSAMLPPLSPRTFSQ